MWGLLCYWLFVFQHVWTTAAFLLHLCQYPLLWSDSQCATCGLKQLKSLYSPWHYLNMTCFHSKKTLSSGLRHYMALCHCPWCYCCGIISANCLCLHSWRRTMVSQSASCCFCCVIVRRRNELNSIQRLAQPLHLSSLIFIVIWQNKACMFLFFSSWSHRCPSWLHLSAGYMFEIFVCILIAERMTREKGLSCVRMMPWCLLTDGEPKSAAFL